MKTTGIGVAIDARNRVLQTNNTDSNCDSDPDRDSELFTRSSEFSEWRLRGVAVCIAGRAERGGLEWPPLPVRSRVDWNVNDQALRIVSTSS